MRMNARGVKVQVSGRLGGAEIARTESEKVGKVPLHTLRADIDYGIATAHTTYGAIGVKVWIYKGEVLPERHRIHAEAAAAPKRRERGRERTASEATISAEKQEEASSGADNETQVQQGE
jgi:small subunit ribosomal protein S3